jgi:hypothetical protein
MNASTLQQKFDRDGYFVLDGFFDDKQMNPIDRVIHKHFGENPNVQHNDEFLNKSQTDVIPWFPQQEGVSDFDAIESDENFRGLSEAILGEGWCEQACMVMFSGRGSSGQAWHQDCPPEDPQQFNLNRLVYTSDIKAESGGQVVVVPGSHKMGLLPAGDPLGTTARSGRAPTQKGHAFTSAWPYLASGVTRESNNSSLYKFQSGIGYHPSRHHRYLCLSQYALPVFDSERY